MRKVGFVLVLLMALLQGFYGLFAYVDPTTFATVRGTLLESPVDADWVQIYASRTLFISLIIGNLLYFREYKLLMWAALFGTVMPITDGYLAYQAQAPLGVVVKHTLTVLYLMITAGVLAKIIKDDRNWLTDK